MKTKDILTGIKKMLSYSKARHHLRLDDNIYYEVSGFKAKIINFIDIFYNLLDLKSNPIIVDSRIVEIPFLYQNLDFETMNKVLDLGCVSSKIAIQLASLGMDVVGIDARSNPLKHKNFKFIQGNFMNIEFPPNIFDCVIAISTIEHIGLPAYNIKPFENGDKIAVHKIYKILKEGGKFIFTVPFGKNLVSRFERNYNSNSLKKLIEMFKIQVVKVYEKNKKDWFISNNNFNRNEKVACVVCIKE